MRLRKIKKFFNHNISFRNINLSLGTKSLLELKDLQIQNLSLQLAQAYKDMGNIEKSNEILKKTFNKYPQQHQALEKILKNYQENSEWYSNRTIKMLH